MRINLPPIWAWILLLAICPFAGWLIGAIPGPHRAAKPAEPVAAAAPAPASGPAPRRVIDVQEIGSTPEQGPASPESQRPTQENVSAWTTYESAVTESRTSGKPILIDFNAEWCGPCQRMKAAVFDDWQFGRAVQTAVIPVSITDRRREEGDNPREIEDLQQRYGVDAFPTLIVYSPKTGRVEKTTGFGDPDRTLRWITEAAKSVQ